MQGSSMCPLILWCNVASQSIDIEEGTVWSDGDGMVSAISLSRGCHHTERLSIWSPFVTGSICHWFLLQRPSNVELCVFFVVNLYSFTALEQIFESPEIWSAMMHMWHRWNGLVKPYSLLKVYLIINNYVSIKFSMVLIEALYIHLHRWTW